MIKHDLTHWPLVLSASIGTPTYADLVGFSEAWNSWLNRNARFAILRILADSEAHTHPPGGASEKKNWLKGNGERVKQQVIGMATVIPPEIYPEISKMNAEKLFGVPAASFLAIDDAIAWLSPLLEAEAIRLHRDSVQDVIAALTK